MQSDYLTHKMTEGEVHHALRLFLGRTLLECTDLEGEAEAWSYILDHESDLLESMSEAVEMFWLHNKPSDVLAP